MDQRRNQQPLSGGQKAGFAFLVLFAFLVIGLGFMQMRTNIFGPFILQANKTAAVEDAQFVFDESIKLQRIDTDKDGLNDFEELNFYQTSPYLPDTDSDGISDKKELDDSTDPLCPEGKDCAIGQESFVPEIDNTDGSFIDKALSDDTSLSSILSLPEVGSSEDLSTLLTDPVALRAALAASGELSPGVLENISDEELLSLAAQALKKTNEEAATVPPVKVVPPVETPVASVDVLDANELQSLIDNPALLRQFLVTSGNMTAEQVAAIDDNTLVTITKTILGAPPAAE